MGRALFDEISEGDTGSRCYKKCGGGGLSILARDISFTKGGKKARSPKDNQTDMIIRALRGARR